MIAVLVYDQIRKKIQPGMEIPKPEAKGKFLVKGWGKRGGEGALIYRIPNHSNPHKPYEKGITLSEFDIAFGHLDECGCFTRKWFSENMLRCSKEGGCNFTTIGGIFVLLGIVRYDRRGVYRKI